MRACRGGRKSELKIRSGFGLVLSPNAVVTSSTWFSSASLLIAPSPLERAVSVSIARSVSRSFWSSRASSTSGSNCLTYFTASAGSAMVSIMARLEARTKAASAFGFSSISFFEARIALPYSFTP